MKRLLTFCLLLSVITASLGFLSTSQKTKGGSKSIFTPKNAHKVIESLSSIFTFSNPEGEAKKSKSNMENTLENIKETLKASGNSDEGWLTFGKRLASLYLTGSKDMLKEKKVLDNVLAKELYNKSPKFLKDSVKAHLGGSIMPVIQERIKDIVKTIKEKNGTTIDAEGKQGILFDPLVFGVNSMINLFWFAAFNAATLPNMGIDNLFYPDYDYDYDALEEGEEDYDEEYGDDYDGEEQGDDYDGEEQGDDYDYQQSETNFLGLNAIDSTLGQGQNHHTNGHGHHSQGQGHHTNEHGHHSQGQDHQAQQSSYVFYPGQRMQPNHVTAAPRHGTPYPYYYQHHHQAFRPNGHG